VGEKMKLAIISEICGNLVALQAFLADIARRKVDHTLCLGNIIGFGPRPFDCMRIVLEHKFFLTLGSIEHLVSQSVLCGPLDFTDDEWRMLTHLQGVFSEKHKETLSRLPRTRKVFLTHAEDQALLMSHTSIGDWSAGRTADSTLQVQTELGLLAKEYFQQRINILCLGNNSYPIFMSSRGQHVERNCDRFGQTFHLKQDNCYLVNPGSIGRAPESSQLAKNELTYAVIEADGKNVTLVYYRAKYDVCLHVQEMREKQFPQSYIDRFLK